MEKPMDKRLDKGVKKTDGQLRNCYETEKLL